MWLPLIIGFIGFIAMLALIGFVTEDRPRLGDSARSSASASSNQSKAVEVARNEAREPAPTARQQKRRGVQQGVGTDPSLPAHMIHAQDRPCCSYVSHAVPGSADIVASAARVSQAAQLAELNALDGKAANLIGFVGIVLTLIYTSSFADGHWTWAMTAGTAALATATVPLAYAVWPKSYKVNPSIDGLRRLFIEAPPETTHAFIAESIERGTLVNQETLKRKKYAIGLATFVIVAGVLFVTASLLYSLNR